MSLTIFTIAIFPSILVATAGYITQSKFKTLLAGIAAFLFGVFTGNPVYMILDGLMAIAGTIVGFKLIEPPVDHRTIEQIIFEEREKHARQLAIEEQEPNIEDTIFSWLISSAVIIAIVVLAILHFTRPINTPKTSIQPNQKRITTPISSKPTQDIKPQTSRPDQIVRPNRSRPRQATTSETKHHETKASEISDQEYNEEASEKLRQCLENQVGGGLASCLSTL